MELEDGGIYVAANLPQHWIVYLEGSCLQLRAAASVWLVPCQPSRGTVRRAMVQWRDLQPATAIPGHLRDLIIGAVPCMTS